jgi:NAD(P)-dependent dehydrogenase (short-subunit alcohol dehydrogenase family)
VHFESLDLADAQETHTRLAALIEQYGAPSAVIHNTAQLSISPFLESEAQTFEALWRNMVLSAFTLAQAVLPAMVQAGRGAFLVSGATASLRGSANFAAFSSAKFALRGLTQSLAREFQPKGLHIAHIILDGLIDTPASRARTGRDPTRMMKPDDIAQAYWNLAHQPISTWTQELDLRPQSETF